MKKAIFIIGIIVALVVAAFAQDHQFDPNAKLPLDPQITVGKLDNGLTYYIRENAYPENRAEFYLILNAGAIQEDDDQNGLAHFCEHMAFNGTENFEKKEIINYLQSIGMKFGPEINAFTSHDVTTYMLQKVPTDVPENIDTSLMVLYEWANKIAFEDEEIDNERGVIHEEWRTRRGPEFRMMTKSDKITYEGSKYAERDVIGDIDIIDSFDYDVIKRFYKDWYRPDLQAIIAVGDFDKNEIEAKIKKMFGDIEGPENPRKREYYEVPDHNDTRVTIQTDKEARYAMLQVIYKHDITKEKTTEQYWRQSVMEGLYSAMLDARYSELLLQENPPFIFGTSMYTNMVRTKDAYMAYAVSNDQQIEQALEAVLVENERVKQHGFTTTELERAKEQMLVDLEKSYKEREKQESANYVWQCYGHFLSNEPVPGIEFQHAFTNSIMDGISVDEISAFAKEWIRDENRVVIVMAPEKEDVVLPTEEDIRNVLAKVETMDIAAYVDQTSDAPLIPEEPVAKPVMTEEINAEMGTVTWKFPNDVTVILMATEHKEDEIRMTAFSLGGSSLYPVDELMSANLATAVTSESGVGTFNQIELQKKMAGKMVSINPYISNYFEGFNGNTTPQDLETMLQMVYLYFMSPRYDQNTFGSFVNRYKGFLANKSLNPSSALQDTVMVTNANYHPRVRPMTSEMMDEADLGTIEYIFNERFGDPSGFNFYFVGNIDIETVRPMMEKYIGGLPKVIRTESYKDNNVRPPKGTIEKVVTRTMEVPKSTVSITFHGEYDFDDYQDRMNLSALCDILDVRYVETVREEEGGTYGVGIRPTQQKFPYEHYSVSIGFDCDPNNAHSLKKIIYREIELLKSEGPKEKDLNGVKENKLKQYNENLKKNNYWLNALKNMDLHGTDKDVIYNYEEYVNKLDAKSLKKAANKFFGDDVVEVILMPENMENNVDNPNMEK